MDLTTISKMVHHQLRLEDAVAKLEAQLKSKKEELRMVAEVDLPEAMDAAGMQELTTSEGHKVSIKDQYVASITEVNRDAAHQWLRAHNFGGLIKRDMTVSFGKGEETEAEACEQFLSAQQYKYRQKEAVHPQTLKAFINEQIAQGSGMPLELFGVHRVVRAAIKRTEQ